MALPPLIALPQNDSRQNAWEGKEYEEVDVGQEGFTVSDPAYMEVGGRIHKEEK